MTTKKQEKQQITFEKAVKPVPFLQGEYFKGMCEIAYASEKQIALYPNKGNEGIVLSLFHKSIVEMASLSNGGRMFRNFDYNNRYLIDNGEIKTENLQQFKENIKEIEQNGFTIFSLEPVAEPVLSASDLF